MLSAYWEAFLDLIYPQNIKCIVCGEETNLIDTLDVCQSCYDQIEFMDVVSNNIYSVAIYHNIAKKMIFDLKYHDRLYIAKTMAILMNDKIKKSDVNFDIIMAVPLHPLKEKQRGFNQTHLIGKHLSKLANKEYVKKALIRTKYTEDMNKLSRIKRFENVEFAFKVIDHSKLEKRDILLIDDVLTTGATVNACSRVLLESGAKSVTILAFAKGISV